MKFDKKLYGIYLTSAVIAIGVIYMGISSFYIVDNVTEGSSVDIAIDKRVDQCWEKKEAQKN
ncbi:MAG: hypothetical protein U9N52_05890 [Campylobacterota bacterium]|nr:hypothetical protein [Campylobacterota bacterium]